MGLKAALATVVLVWASAAFAQDYDAAGKHFAAGQERYAQRRYHTAALQFQATYDITKDAVLLYNIGEAWQKAAEPAKAIAAYKAYLKERPDAQDRADVEKRITLLENKKGIADESVAGDKDEAAGWLKSGGAPLPAEPAAAATPGPATPTPAPAEAPTPPAATQPPAPAAAPEPTPAQVGVLDERPASKLRVAAWVSVATTIAFLTTGAILGLAAQARADELTRRLNFVDASGQPREFDAGAQTDFKNLTDEGKLYNGLAIGFYSAAGAMAITTTVLFVVDWKNGKRHKQQARGLQLAPQLGAGAAGLVLGGRF